MEKEHVFGINTILHTKDGRKVGNAIVTGRDYLLWEITTDYGNKVSISQEAIDELFYIAWSDCTYKKDGYSCAEMQEMVSSDHKYRVNL